MKRRAWRAWRKGNQHEKATSPENASARTFFLVDSGIISAIVSAINPQRSDAVVEIGPGLAP